MTTARTPTHSTSQPPSGDVAAIVSVIAMIASPSRAPSSPPPNRNGI